MLYCLVFVNKFVILNVTCVPPLSGTFPQSHLRREAKEKFFRGGKVVKGKAGGGTVNTKLLCYKGS
jgi:hypothetical protein